MMRTLGLILLSALVGCSELPLKDESGSAVAEVGTGGVSVLPTGAAVGGAPAVSVAGATSSPHAGASASAGEGGATGTGGGADTKGGAGTGGGPGTGGGAGSQAGGGAVSGQNEVKLHAGLYSEVTQDPTNELHPFLLLSNEGPYPLELRRIKIRYYVSAESPFTPAFNCFYVTGSLCHQLLQSFDKLSTPRPDATHFIEFSFRTDDARVLGPTPLEIRTALASGGEPMTQANDFSYVDSHGTLESVSGFDYELTNRITVYLDGQLVWGDEPCPQ